MEELLKTLNDRQREAVEYLDGPLLVLAGAGSGKTRVLTFKIAYLVLSGVIKPYEILAITFTNKAAKEMKERTRKILDTSASDLWLGTFHNICIRILKREIEYIGYSRNFNIFDEDDKGKLLKKIIKDLDLDDKSYSAKSVGYEISAAKNEMIGPDKYYAINKSDFRKKKMAEIYEKYQIELQRNDALDFDDIINHTIKLFEEFPERLAYYRNKFKYVLVDEYQDTNKAQFMLISLLSSKGNVCVVGDESQSIYGWRGADIKNILNFEKQFTNAKIVKLEENYRSTKNILNAANAVIKNNESRLEKNLWTQNNEGDKIFLYNAANEYDESRYVIRNIIESVKKCERKYSDFAILYRTNVQSRIFEENLIREGIPYKLIGGLKFYGRKEIKDIMAYLKIINNQKDNVSLKRVINEPKRGIGATSIDKLENLADAKECSIFELIKDDENLSLFRAANSLRNFRDILQNIISNKNKMKISEMVSEILDKTGYLDELKKEKTKENENRIENICELLGVISEFEKEEAENGLAEFLETVALVSDVDKLDETQDSVTLMTLHSAKGLEYPVIFLVGMEEGLFPSSRSIGEHEQLEEERRLCYVGITRAMQKLYLTSANQRTIYGSTSYTMPSRFLGEIPKEYIEGDVDKSKVDTYNKVKDAFNKMASAPSIETRDTGFGISAASFLKNMTQKGVEKDINLAELVPGVTVEHKKFGIGKIKKVEKEGGDSKIEIEFEGFGMKRMMAKFAGLKIIQ
ncbi:MAG: DNA helicase PcrA [Clostridia bacterium]